mgnify:CR=1 FL=1
MPIDMKIVDAQAKTGKRFTAIFRIHKSGKVIKITHFGQRKTKKALRLLQDFMKEELQNLLLQ